MTKIATTPAGLTPRPSAPPLAVGLGRHLARARRPAGGARGRPPGGRGGRRTQTDRLFRGTLPRRGPGRLTASGPGGWRPAPETETAPPARRPGPRRSLGLPPPRHPRWNRYRSTRFDRRTTRLPL